MSTAIVEILETYEPRELQIEASRVLACNPATNRFIKQFVADHDSRQFYKNVIIWYYNKYNCMPSMGGPAEKVKMVYDQ